MELGYISKNQLPQFRSLLLPEVSQELENEGSTMLLLGLTEDDAAVGALAAGINMGGELELVSLFVAPDYRRRGGGRLLVETLLTQVHEQLPHCLVTADFTITDPDNETLPPFLKALGFQQEADRGENIYDTTLGEVLKSPFFHLKSVGDSSKLMPFSKLSQAALLEAEHMARKALIPLPDGGLLGTGVNRELSCALAQGGIVQAFLLFEQLPGQPLTLASAWNGAAGPSAIPALLHTALHRAEQTLPPETPMSVQSVNQASARLIRKLVPEAMPVSMSWYYFLSQMSQKGDN